MWHFHYIRPPRIFEVGKAPWMFDGIQEAITYINEKEPASSANRAQVFIHPGFYRSETPIVVPSFVSIKGADKFSVQLQNDSSDLFFLNGNHTAFFDFLVEGSPTAGLFAFRCNNFSNIHIRNVDMLGQGGIARQLFLHQSGSTWRTFLFEHCILDGFNTSGTLCQFVGTASAAHDVDTHINDCFIDTLHLTGFGGGVQVRGIFEFNVRGSLIRGANAFQTGVRVEKPGGQSGTPSCLITNSYLTAGVPVFGEAGTHYTLTNVDALGSLTSGTRTLRNSSV